MLSVGAVGYLAAFVLVRGEYKRQRAALPLPDSIAL